MNPTLITTNMPIDENFLIAWAVVSILVVIGIGIRKVIKLWKE